MDNKSPASSAEIDLLYFFRPLGNLLKKTGNGIVYIIKKILANKFLFSIIVLLISAGGYSLRYFIQPAYQTDGIFVSSVLPAKYCGMLLKNLNKLKGEENKPLLARQLKISEDASDDIRSIIMLPIRDTFYLDKRDTALSLFRIKLILKKMDNLDTIQWGLMNYLENNAYAIKRKEARRKSLESLKATLITKLESLDSLKKIVNSSIIPRSEGKGIILGEPVNPIGVYQAEVAYYREQLNIDQALATIDNIEVVQPFLKLNRQNYPRFNRIFIYFFLASGLIAGFIVLVAGKNPN